MSKVVLELSMSLDGFIAGPNDNPENGLGDGGDALLKWYSSGDTDFPLPSTDMVFKISHKRRVSSTVLAEYRCVGHEAENLRYCARVGR